MNIINSVAELKRDLMMPEREREREKSSVVISHVINDSAGNDYKPLL
jgi:hypothetical protein